MNIIDAIEYVFEYSFYLATFALAILSQYNDNFNILTVAGITLVVAQQIRLERKLQMKRVI